VHAFRTHLLVVLGCLLLLGVALCPWTSWESGYARFFRAEARLLFGLPAGEHTLALTELPPIRGGNDVAIVLRRPASGQVWRGSMRSYFGYLPTNVFLALVVVVPLAARRRWRTFVWGGLVVNAYTMLGAFLFLLKAWTAHVPQCSGTHAGLVASAAWRHGLDLCASALVESRSMNLLVPCVVFAAFATDAAARRALFVRSPAGDAGCGARRSTPAPAVIADSCAGAQAALASHSEHRKGD
jgi:hypothetical protein